MILLLLFVVFTYSTPICFGPPSNQCLELTSFVASASLRSNFVGHCQGGNGFWPSDCQIFAGRITDLFGPVPEVPDLASLLYYTEGFAFAANNALRKQNGQNVDASMQYAIEMIASGISVMRANRTVQLSTNEVYGGFAASYRGESNYIGAPCVFGSGQPAFERLNTSETLWGFSSSSMSIEYAQSWPWQQQSPRVIVMARNITNVSSGAAIVWPIPVLNQMEITFPPGTDFQHLACERTIYNGANVALLYGYDRSNANRLSASDESTLLRSLQKLVTRNQQGCYRYICAYFCGVPDTSKASAVPSACDCFDTRGRRPPPNFDANAIVTPDFTIATCRPIADQSMLIKLNDWEGLCLTATSASVGARISTQLCDGSSRSSLQAFYFDARGFIMLNVTRDWATGPLCLNVWNGNFAPGNIVQLYGCQINPMQNNDRFKAVQSLTDIALEVSFVNNVCLNFDAAHVMNQTLVVATCNWGGSQLFVPIPFDLELPHHSDPWLRRRRR